MRGAGGGRPSKGAAARNRNKPTHETVQLPSSHDGPVPEAPDWLPHVEEWERLWRCPEASQWTVGDVPGLARMLLLQSEGSVIEDARLLAELRQLEDRFGLNAYARRQLRWLKSGDDQLPQDQKPGAEVRRLRAVDAAG